MRAHVLVYITALCMTLLAVQPVFADISWSMTDTSTEGSEQTVIHQTIHISGERFAIVNDQGMRIIIDLPADTMTMINTTEKTYSVISLSEMAQNIENIQNDTDKMIEEALKQIPAEQRAQYEAIIRQQMGSIEQPAVQEPEPIDYSPTGESEKIAGYDSKQYTGTDENGAEQELWCSKDVSTDEIMTFYNAISNIDFFNEMPSNDENLDLGFPMKTIIKQDGYIYQSEVTEISFDKVDNGLFTIPNGLEKTEFGF